MRQGVSRPDISSNRSRLLGRDGDRPVCLQHARDCDQSGESRTAITDALGRKVLLLTKRRAKSISTRSSALHKSVRSSYLDAALDRLARMLESGEDRMYIARRVVRMAIEDIGLADPRALEQCMAMQQCVHFLGMPEGDLVIAQRPVIYLSGRAEVRRIIQSSGAK